MQEIKISFKNVKTIVAIGGVVILAVIASLYFGVINPSWNPFLKSPKEIINKARENLLDLETIKAQGKIEISINAPQQIQGVLNFLADFDQGDKENIGLSTNIEAKIGLEGVEISLEMALKVFKESVYLKLDTIPLFLTSADLTTIKGKWIKIDKSILGEASETQNLPTAVLLEEIKKAMADKEIMVLKKDYGLEKLEENEVFHYKVEAQKEEVKKFLIDLFGSLEKYSSEENKESYQQGLKTLPQRFDEFWQEIGGIEFDAWIGKTDKNLRKIKIEKEIAVPPSESIPENTKIKIGAEINFSDFNKKIEIEEPKDFINYQDISPTIQGTDQGFNLPLIPENGFLPEE